MPARVCVFLAALLGGTAVVLGSYHAHGLEKALAGQGLDSAAIAKRMDNCDTGVRYQMAHALALLAIGSAASRNGGRIGWVAPIAWTLGVILFCGGLYALVFAGPVLHWSVVPLGGLTLIVGWGALALGTLFAEKRAAD